MAQLMVPAPALVQAYTVSVLAADVVVTVGAAPFQSTLVLLPTTGVVGTPGMPEAEVQVTVSTVVLVEPTRSRISLGTVTLRFALACAVIVPVPEPYWLSAMAGPPARARPVSEAASARRAMGFRVMKSPWGCVCGEKRNRKVGVVVHSPTLTTGIAAVAWPRNGTFTLVSVSPVAPQGSGTLSSVSVS